MEPVVVPAAVLVLVLVLTLPFVHLALIEIETFLSLEAHCFYPTNQSAVLQHQMAALAGQKPLRKGNPSSSSLPSNGLLFDSQSLKSLLNIPNRHNGAPGEKKVSSIPLFTFLPSDFCCREKDLTNQFQMNIKIYFNPS
jgi:hypothetical protein